MTAFTESPVEQAALGWLETLGYRVLHGPDIAVGQPRAERSDPAFRDVVLERRLRDTLLPKLISGELRLPAALRDRSAQAGVKEAERFLEERGL